MWLWPGDVSLAGRFGSGRDMWLRPVDVALAGRCGSGQEMWLSPVTQGTGEARVVGWLRVNDLNRDSDMASEPLLQVSICALQTHLTAASSRARVRDDQTLLSILYCTVML
jgi:hypothetical protein